MSQFNIHFFKEKSRKIDLEYLISFFENIEGITTEMDERSVRFLYLHPKLNYEALFEITPKSEVPDIYRLSPRFLDLNFHLEMPILTPDFVAKEIFELTKKIADQFGFAIYNELFEDVLTFKMEVVLKVFQMIKEAYIDKNAVLIQEYHLLPKEELHAIFRYLNDIFELQNYYRDLQTYVPKYHFFTLDTKDLAIGIEFREQTLTVLPPRIDYLFYYVNNEMKVIDYEDAFTLIEKHLQKVPGFIEGTYVVPKKTAKKIHKILRKTKFEQTNHTFTKISVKQLLD